MEIRNMMRYYLLHFEVKVEIVEIFTSKFLAIIDAIFKGFEIVSCFL